MANTFTQQTAFLQDQYYYEEDFAKVWAMGMPSFITKGGDISTDNTISAMEGVNNGVFFKLSGKQDIPTSGTTNLYIHSHLAGVAGSYTELKSDASNSIQNTDSDKYFKIYALNNGDIVEDFRHQDFIKDMEVVGDSTSFSLVINGKESNALPLGELQNAYTKDESDNQYVYKVNFAEYTSDADFAGKNAGACAWLMVKSIADLTADKRTLIEGYRVIEKATSPNLHGIFANLVEYTGNARMFIYYKPSAISDRANLAEFNIIVEGVPTEIHYWNFNNYNVDGSVEPVKTSDALQSSQLYAENVFSNGIPVTGERHRSFVGYQGIANMNEGQQITLNMQGYSMAQVQKLTIVWSNYESGTSNAVNQNIEEKQLTNFISGGSHDGYDGFYDTHVFSEPYSASVRNSDGTVPSYVKAINVESTGIIKGQSEANVYTSGGKNYGYAIRTVFVTIADNHWTKPANATSRTTDRDYENMWREELEKQIAQDQRDIENGVPVDLDSIETMDQKVERLVKEQLNNLGVTYENN